MAQGLADDAVDSKTLMAHGFQVVVLHQNAVGQIHTVVPCSAHANGVFIQQPESRRCLAGVHDASSGPFGQLDVAGGFRGYAAHALEEIYGCTLCPQNGSRLAVDEGQVVSW